MTATRLIDRIESFYDANPGASVTTLEGMARWGCTEHTLRESMRALRRRGVGIRCERVYRRRDQPTGRTGMTVDQMLLGKLSAVLATRVAPIFLPGTKLAILARTPGDDRADVLVTDDDIDDLIALLQRSKAREEVKPPLRQPTPDSRPLLPPAGYTAEELERDNPFNAWMHP